MYLYFLCPYQLVPLQEDLSKADQEVMKSKHHKKHYDEKRGVHLKNIQNVEAQLKSKEKELEVC